MTGVLLDTNVISELTRPKPAPPVIAFLAAQEDLWLSALVLHELEFGVLPLPSGGRRDALRGVLSELLRRYEDRVIAVDTEAATWAAKFRVDARRCGRTLDLGDALIAGTASRPWIKGLPGRATCASFWRRTTGPGCAERPVLGVERPNSRQ